MSVETIKDFLVSLSFAVDQHNERKFNTSIEAATGRVALLGTALVGAAIAITTMAEKFAQHGERIYWLGQRAKASASGIESMAFAASQLGSSTDAAYSSIESFGRFLQSAPGAKAFVEKWTGPFVNSEEALIQFGKRMKDVPAYFRNALASTMGLDYNFAQSLFSGDFEKQVEERKKRATSVSFDENKFAEDSKKFMQSWRTMWDEVEIISKSVAVTLFDPLEQSFTGFTTFLNDNSPKIAEQVAEFAKDVTSAFKTIASVGGDVAAILNALVTGEYAKAFEALSHIGKTLMENESVKDHLTYNKETDIVSPFLEKYSKAGSAKEAFDAIGPWLKKHLGIGAAQGAWEEGSDLGSTVEEGMQFFMKRGRSREQAAGIMANLSMESTLNPGAVGDEGAAYGLAQWHPDRQAKFKEIMGKPIRGSSRQDQYAFFDWELRNSEADRGGNRLARARTASEAAENVVDVERPKDRAGAVADRARLAEVYASHFQGALLGGTGTPGMPSAPPSINQTNNITVNGATDPTATSSAIGRELGRLNGVMVRDLAGALR